MILQNMPSKQELPPNGKQYRWPSSCMQTSGLEKESRKLRTTPGWSLWSQQLSRTDRHPVFVAFPWPTATLDSHLWNSFRQFYVKEHSSKRWSIWDGQQEGDSMPPKRRPRLFAVLQGTTDSCGSWLHHSPAIYSSLLWLAFSLYSLSPSDVPVGYSMRFLNPFYPL